MTVPIRNLTLTGFVLEFQDYFGSSLPSINLKDAISAEKLNYDYESDSFIRYTFHFRDGNEVQINFTFKEDTKKYEYMLFSYGLKNQKPTLA